MILDKEPYGAVKFTEYTYPTVTTNENGYAFLNVPDEVKNRSLFSVGFISWGTAPEPPYGWAMIEAQNQFIIYTRTANMTFTNFKVRFLYV